MSITFTAYIVISQDDGTYLSEFVDGAPEANFSNGNAWRVMTPLLAAIGKEMDHSGGVSDIVDLHTMRGVCQDEGYRKLMGPDSQRYRTLGDIIDYCTENGYEFGWG